MKNLVDIAIVVIVLVAAWGLVCIHSNFSQPPPLPKGEWIKVKGVVITLPEIGNQIKVGDMTMYKTAKILSIEPCLTEKYKKFFIVFADKKNEYLIGYSVKAELYCTKKDGILYYVKNLRNIPHQIFIPASVTLHFQKYAINLHLLEIDI